MLLHHESFSHTLQPADLEARGNLREKEMLLTTLRFYRPAHGW